jgi:hypothetical protein
MFALYSLNIPRGFVQDDDVLHALCHSIACCYCVCCWEAAVMLLLRYAGFCDMEADELGAP